MKRFLSNTDWTEGGKERIAEGLDRFYQYKCIRWERPRYEAVDILPHIPTSTTVQELVSGLSGPVGTFTMLLCSTFESDDVENGVVTILLCIFTHAPRIET